MDYTKFFDDDLKELNEDTDVEQLLRSKNIKIKDINFTNFGTEYILAKKYDASDLEDILKGFKIKIKGNSVFVED